MKMFKIDDSLPPALFAQLSRMDKGGGKKKGKKGKKGKKKKKKVCGLWLWLCCGTCFVLACSTDSAFVLCVVGVLLGWEHAVMSLLKPAPSRVATPTNKTQLY